MAAPASRQAPREVRSSPTTTIHASDTVVLDAGPIAYAFAQAIPEDFAGCVITHSMPVPQLFDQRQPRLARSPSASRQARASGVSRIVTVARPAACSARASAGAAPPAPRRAGRAGGPAGRRGPT